MPPIAKVKSNRSGAMDEGKEREADEEIALGKRRKKMVMMITYLCSLQQQREVIFV